MILHLQKFLFASVVTAALSAFSPYIPNTSHLSLGLQAPPRIIHTVIPSQHAKIEQNIFTLWSPS
jgi:hypothetical protein